MATIVKRSSSRWQVKVRREGFPLLCKTLDTHKQAVTWARQQEGDIDAGVFTDRSEAALVSFRALLERYLTEISPKKRSGKGERSRLSAYLHLPLFQRPILTISQRDVAALRDWRLEQVTPGTVLREFCILRHALHTARKDWFLPIDNFVQNIRLPTANPPRARRLEHGELETLITSAQCYGGVMPLLIEWQVETGMEVL